MCVARLYKFLLSQMAHSQNRSTADLEAELSRCQTELQILRSSMEDSGARDRSLTELLDKVQVNSDALSIIAPAAIMISVSVRI